MLTFLTYYSVGIHPRLDQGLAEVFRMLKVNVFPRWSCPEKGVRIFLSCILKENPYSCNKKDEKDVSK